MSPALGLLPRVLRSRLFLAALLVGALFVLLPELGLFSSSTRLSLGSRACLALLMAAGIASIDVGEATPSRAWVYVGSVLAMATGSWAVLDSGKPHSFYWTLLLVPLFAQARARAPDVALWALTGAFPLGVAGTFVARGSAVDEVAAPLSLAAFFPLLYVSLAQSAARVRSAGRRRAVQEAKAAAARDEHRRLAMTREVREFAAKELSVAADAAARAVSALHRAERAAAQEAARTAAHLREALHAVRESIWALDPDAAAWEAVEPHLRRMVADLAAPGSACSFEVPGGELVSSDDRVRLMRHLRRALSRAPGPVHVRVDKSGPRLELSTRGGEETMSGS